MSEEQKSDSGGTPPPPAPGVPKYMSPRLRARLEMQDEPPPPSENPWLGWLAMAVIAAMIGGLVYWRIQKNHAEAKEAADKAAAERRLVVADSLHSLAVLVDHSRARRDDRRRKRAGQRRDVYRDAAGATHR